MIRKRAPSPQAVGLLAELARAPRIWHHGYELTKALGIKSGTLYPLLMRLEGQGLLEAEWRESDQPGRPARHAYRLTAQGLQAARDATTTGPGETFPVAS
ncbi:PadR family transcriptional regulator [Roseateles aquatilis]|uniref:PadR family transcriptional regulator n=1 Tax=Roseateles aquatilis TaxID=431061 RepID=A0A2D0AM38_9BURK|nr:PadR family transcriptional regulator [Roseateles aquatilis]OWQ85293.1 PadR family transcriptional regulator [Roseateles aquatilis]